MPLPGINTERYNEIADKLGISISHVWDLASHDDEAASTLSISQVKILSELTGLPITTILGVRPSSVPMNQVIAPDLLCVAIKDMLEARNIPLTEFEEQVGWEIGGFIDEPYRLYDIVNWDSLMDIASSVGINPLAILPPEN